MRVSIVIPSLNSGRFLATALDSILAQPEVSSAAEIIVVDGGSTDGTPLVLDRYRGCLARVIVEPDTGPAAAINKGLRLARGQVLAWLNADDLYHAGALARAVSAFKRRPAAALAFGRCRIVDAEGREIRRAITMFKQSMFPLACRPLIQTINFISQPAMFFSRRALLAAGPLREDLKAAFDYECIRRLWRHGGAVRLHGPPVAAFRWHRDSISGRGFERQFLEEWEAAVADAGRFSPQVLLHAVVRRGIVACYRRMAAAQPASPRGREE